MHHIQPIRKAIRVRVYRFGLAHAGAFLFSCIAATVASAQFPPPNSTNTQPRGAATVVVAVLGENGAPPETGGEVTLAPNGEISGTTESTGSNGVARFSRVPSGTYSVVVRIPGFKEATGSVEVAMNYGTFTTSVTVEPEADETHESKGFLLAPKAKKELEAGVAALRAHHNDEAQKHLDVAYKLAPGSPEVNDVMGELYLQTKDYTKAQEYIQQAISIEPQNVAALTDMGELRVVQRSYIDAQIPLEQSIVLDPQNWFAHWPLGVAYLHMNDNEKARVEALAAIKAGKGAADDAEYLLGEALAALGRTGEAVQALQTFIASSPKNSYAPSAQAIIAKLQGGEANTTPTPALPVPVVPEPPSTRSARP